MPRELEYLPELQLWQDEKEPSLTTENAGMPSPVEYFPASHETHELAPLAENVPAGHVFEQSFEKFDPIIVEKVPGLHR